MSNRVISRFIIGNVAYYSQWESPELVGRFVRREISAKDDPLWMQSGAKTKAEYEYWAVNMCGMACLKMILLHELGKFIPIVELGKKCLEFGGYVEREGRIDGLYYAPFLEFIQNNFRLTGKILAPMSIDTMQIELSKHNFVMASVNGEIRDPESEPSKKGGHLILVLGFDSKKKLLVFHNPSGYHKNNQSYATISFDKFSKFFVERGISIESNLPKQLSS